MNDRDHGRPEAPTPDDRSTTTGEEQRPRRRPYRKPELETGEELERTVLASCDTGSVFPAICPTPGG